MHTRHLCLPEILKNHNHHDRVVDKLIDFFEAESEIVFVNVNNGMLLLFKVFVFQVSKEIVVCVLED